MPESSELLAKRISEAGTGVHPISKVREAVFKEALAVIRRIRIENLPADETDAG